MGPGPPMRPPHFPCWPAFIQHVQCNEASAVQGNGSMQPSVAGSGLQLGISGGTVVLASGRRGSRHKPWENAHRWHHTQLHQ